MILLCLSDHHRHLHFDCIFSCFAKFSDIFDISKLRWTFNYKVVLTMYSSKGEGLFSSLCRGALRVDSRKSLLTCLEGKINHHFSGQGIGSINETKISGPHCSWESLLDLVFHIKIIYPIYTYQRTHKYLIKKPPSAKLYSCIHLQWSPFGVVLVLIDLIPFIHKRGKQTRAEDDVEFENSVKEKWCISKAFLLSTM